MGEPKKRRAKEELALKEPLCPVKDPELIVISWRLLLLLPDGSAIGWALAAAAMGL